MKRLLLIPAFYILVSLPLVVGWSPPIVAQPTPPYIVKIKPAVPLPQTKLQPQEEAVAAVVPSEVVPAPSITNCGSDPYMAQIYSHESGCNTASINYIGCAGLGQACPGSKLPCSLTDWDCQNNYFINYANSVYGSPALAWAAWQAKGWW